MLNKKALAASVSAPPAEYVEDVFSTYLYTGNGSTQTITNGIDLAGEGGLVWAKWRNDAVSHFLFDTARGATNYISSDATDAQSTISGLTSFNSNGFTLGSYSGINNSGSPNVSWTFRKAPKFFDVVTYTGNGASDQTISHNLGSTPGFIVVKATSTTSAWWCYHRGLSTPNNFQIRLSSNAAAGDTGGNAWNVTSTTFNASGSLLGINASGQTYVAYIFAHNAGGFGAAGTDNIISCGTFTTDGSGNATVNLGYEPQYILCKYTSTSPWYVFDTMRGLSLNAQAGLFPNATTAENTYTGTGLFPTATGFSTQGTSLFDANATLIYMAIRRPMKTPTSGTEVFSPQTWTGNDTARSISGASLPTDFTLIRDRSANTGYSFVVNDRLRGSSNVLRTWTTDSESAGISQGITSFNMSGVSLGTDSSNYGYNKSSNPTIGLFFTRRTGFFDIVCYTGDGTTNRSLNHNLGVVPEIIIAKNRASAQDWVVFGTSALGANNYLLLNTTGALNPYGGVGNLIASTSTTFGAQANLSYNDSGITYVAYLFASVTGVSKVGSYTGNGSSQTINCGFTAGARFVLIKRTDASGSWYVFDTARGIVSGNDPFLLLNSTAAEVTTRDAVDPDNSGFIVNNDGTNFPINVNAATYIFYAVA